MALGLYGELFVRGSIIVAGDPTVTAVNLLSAQSLWRIGIATDLTMHVLDLPLIVLFYLLLRPVNRNLALIATGLNLGQTAVLVANKTHLVAPLLLLTESAATAIPLAQRQAWAYLAIDAHALGFGIGLIFFGLACVVRAVLILRSPHVPHLLGWLLGVAGAAYLVNSVALLIAPGLAQLLFPAILLPPLIGELALCLWLLFGCIVLPRKPAQDTHLAWPAGTSLTRP